MSTDGRNEDGVEPVALPGISNFLAGPNPATDQINIQFDADRSLEATVLMMDLTGRVVLQTNVSATEGQNRITVPVSTLTNGLYLLTVKAGDEVITVKMVLSR
jgi:hypothetical protein